MSTKPGLRSSTSALRERSRTPDHGRSESLQAFYQRFSGPIRTFRSVREGADAWRATTCGHGVLQPLPHARALDQESPGSSPGGATEAQVERPALSLLTINQRAGPAASARLLGSKSHSTFGLPSGVAGSNVTTRVAGLARRSTRAVPISMPDCPDGGAEGVNPSLHLLQELLAQ